MADSLHNIYIGTFVSDVKVKFWKNFRLIILEKNDAALVWQSISIRELESDQACERSSNSLPTFSISFNNDSFTTCINIVFDIQG